MTPSVPRAASSNPDENRPVAEASSDPLLAIFRDHQAELLGSLVHVVGNRDDAKDALQEAFIKCWRHRDQLGEIGSLKAWVFQVVINAGRDFRQTAWKRKRRPLPEGIDQVDPRQSPQESTERREEIDRVRSALSELNDAEKEVFLLRENGELTYEEIGQQLGVPTGTVKTRMRSALARLRSALRNESSATPSAGSEGKSLHE